MKPGFFTESARFIVALPSRNPRDGSQSREYKIGTYVSFNAKGKTCPLPRDKNHGRSPGSLFYHGRPASRRRSARRNRRSMDFRRAAGASSPAGGNAREIPDRSRPFSTLFPENVAENVSRRDAVFCNIASHRVASLSLRTTRKIDRQTQSPQRARVSYCTRGTAAFFWFH